jgi:epoxyqueuosine reductase QueG
LLKAGLFLQKNGYRYITVAASQSINKDGWNYKGRYSHKKAATLSGLGTIGKSSMFLHKDYGARVRLGTLVTDCEFDVSDVVQLDLCNGCDRCVKACPSGAITGNMWIEGCDREYMFDPEKCSNHMKTHFKHIGRGAVCGICMKVCPYGK